MDAADVGKSVMTGPTATRSETEMLASRTGVHPRSAMHVFPGRPLVTIPLSQRGG